MLRYFLAPSILLASSQAFAAEPFPKFRPGGHTTPGPDGHRSQHGKLAERFCFSKNHGGNAHTEFCLPAGSDVAIDGVSSVMIFTAPISVSIFGIAFEAGTEVNLGSFPSSIAGTLVKPLELEGRLLQGRAMVHFEDGKPVRASQGILARETIIGQWRVPKGFAFSEQTYEEHNFARTAFAAYGSVATRIEAAPAPLPDRITEYFDVAGGFGGWVSVSLKFDATFAVGRFSLSKSGVSWRARPAVANGALTLWHIFAGTLARPAKIGIVDVPSQSTVVLCGDDELERAEAPEGVQIRVGPYHTASVEAFREAPLSVGTKSSSLSGCGTGKLSGYRFRVLRRCETTVRTLTVTPDGKPADAETETLFSEPPPRGPCPKTTK
jgi:hypothetical protein